MLKADRDARAKARRRALESLKEMSAAEDRAITKAARSDPDARPLTDVFFKRKPLSQAQVADIAQAFRRARGRPASERKKVPVTIRLDPEIVAALKSEGPGWQTRLNALLARWVRRRGKAA
jgi:uncharacterized protein (DUF4415 family)